MFSPVLPSWFLLLPRQIQGRPPEALTREAPPRERMASGQPLLPPRLSGLLCVPCTPVSWFSGVCLCKPKDVGCREASNAGSGQGTGSQGPEATSTVYSLRDPYLWTPWRDAPRPRHHSMGSRFATVLRFTENLEKLELNSRAISLKPGPKSATSLTQTTQAHSHGHLTDSLLGSSTLNIYCI